MTTRNTITKRINTKGEGSIDTYCEKEGGAENNSKKKRGVCYQLIPSLFFKGKQKENFSLNLESIINLS